VINYIRRFYLRFCAYEIEKCPFSRTYLTKYSHHDHLTMLFLEYNEGNLYLILPRLTSLCMLTPSEGSHAVTISGLVFSKNIIEKPLVTQMFIYSTYVMNLHHLWIQSCKLWIDFCMSVLKDVITVISKVIAFEKLKHFNLPVMDKRSEQHYYYCSFSEKYFF